MRRFRTAGALERRVAAFLVGLGSTGAEIAARLACEGVRGVPGDTDDCGLAVYLHAVLGPDHQVRSVKVTGDAVAVYRWRRRGIAVPLPEPVRAFIGEFDKGRFPILVRIGNGKGAGTAAAIVHTPQSSTRREASPPRAGRQHWRVPRLLLRGLQAPGPRTGLGRRWGLLARRRKG